jgi:cyclic pyranopterin phosphate synthase
MSMSAALIDSFGRRHNNLRISVTDRCNLRCTYCMPESVQFLPRDLLLSFEEIARFVRVAAGLGIDKVRLTGGEPLVRKDLHKLIHLLVAVPSIRDVGLTTNGILLAEQADDLFSAGLRRINISLDTLDADKFSVLTRRNRFQDVLAGIDAAQRVGFDPIKINAVAIAGVSEQDVVSLARFCRDRTLELRFIEFMPLEADNIWERSKVLSASTILALLNSAGLAVVPHERSDVAAPAQEYEYADGRGRIGIIASVTRPFCMQCNRIRLTAEGKLRNCLFALDELDVKTPMRAGATDAELADLIRQCVAAKWSGHQINTPSFVKPSRTMHAIGG